MSSTPNPLDEIFQAVLGGDEDAFDALFRRLHAPLLGYARSLRAEQGEATDAVQNAFVRLWTQRETFDASGSVRALLYTMVRNDMLSRKRKESRRRELRGAHAGPEKGPRTPSEHAAGRALRQRVQKWIAALPERRQEAFRLSRFADLTHEEIARVMDISPRTVETHIRLALEDLRERLTAYDPDLLPS